MSVQAVHNRWENQGPKHSRSVPKKYGRDEAEWVLKSETRVIDFMEVDTAKLNLGVRQPVMQSGIE